MPLIQSKASKAKHNISAENWDKLVSKGESAKYKVLDEETEPIKVPNPPEVKLPVKVETEAKEEIVTKSKAKAKP